MADAVQGPGFWLPSEFFDDFPTGNSDSGYSFPPDFPYDLQKHTQLNAEKPTSPQSTLVHAGTWSAGGSTNGSPNAVYSPPTTPFSANLNGVGDLIYRAAGQVAKLKMNAADGPPGPTKPKGLLVVSAPRNPNPSAYHTIYLQQQSQVSQIKRGRTVGQNSWSIQQNPTRVFGSRSGVRAGTGVFLPRRYNVIGNSDSNGYTPDPRKGAGCAFVPQRNVHVHDKSLDDMTSFAQPPHPLRNNNKCGKGFASEYDLLMARRNALMLQIRRSLVHEGLSPVGRGVHLPQEWTY